MAAADGPRHALDARPDAMDPNDAAAERSSAARPSQAVAARSIGPVPAPANTRAEMIPGGASEKFIALVLSRLSSLSSCVCRPVLAGPLLRPAPPSHDGHSLVIAGWWHGLFR